MEREILEIFDVAKRAGEAAAAEGGAAEVARCLDALKRLRKLPLATKELVATKVGKSILCLTKNPEKKIQSAASELRQYWKDLVVKEVTNSKKNNISEDNTSPKVEAKSQNSGAERDVKSVDMKLERNGLHESVRNENLSRSIKVENMGCNVTIEAQKTSGDRPFKIEKITKEVTNSKKNNMSEDNASLKVEAKSQNSGAERDVKSDDMKLERNDLHESVRNENLSRSIKVENMGYNGTIEVQKTSGDRPVKIEKITKEVTSSKKNNISEDNASLKVEAKSQNSGAERNVKSDDVKLERNGLHESVRNVNLSRSIKVENMGYNGIIEVQKTSGDRPVKIEKITKEEKHPSQVRPPKLTSMLRCNDELRDKFREIIAEALSKVHGEAPEDIREEVAACDPIRVAVLVESLMFEKLGRSNGSQKAKYRSIMFNMKDSKNPDLRRRLLLGEVKPLDLINMTAEELASDDRKRQIQHIKDKAIFECERGAPPKATTDQFKCGRCGKRKTIYHQMQTRSADEPMTTYVTCVECNHNWKFC